MKYPIIYLFLPILSLLAVPPVPYSGKVAFNGENLNGTYSFSFALRDASGTIHWRNGKTEMDAIKIVLLNGRYTVLLGGQGMNPLPADLFHKQSELYLKVLFDNLDGKDFRLYHPTNASLPLHMHSHRNGQNLPIQ